MILRTEGFLKMIRFSLVTGLVFGLAFGVSGCNSQKDYKTADAIKQAPPLAEHGHDHGHAEKGPHGGSLVELGDEEYHAEVVVDADADSLLVYLLGKDAKTAVPVAAPEVSVALAGKDPVTLKASAQPDDGEGKASKFTIVDRDFVHKIMDEGVMHGDLRITIEDKPYRGEIDYHLDGSAHEHHDEKK
jgi:hypothetical protein